MSLLLETEREAVVRTACRMLNDKLIVGTSGNVSLRGGDLVAITPSGMHYQMMEPVDVTVVDLAGNVVHGDLKPSVELPLHLAGYNSLDAKAVIHTHSTAAVALSLLQDEIPRVHYQLAMFGGSVRVAPYATYGTDELVENVIAAMADRTGCIMKHHGTVCLGENLEQAYDRAQQLEWLCDVWLRARAVGEPALLAEEELKTVTAKFARYGQQPGDVA